MIQKILTGADGTATATEAARTAAALAQPLEAELHVISAYGPMEERTVQAENHTLQVSPKEHANTFAEDAAALLRKEFPDLTVIALPTEGRPAKALITHAEEIGADLIVVGNKRVQGLTRILGSIAADVAQKAHCDVYVAHTHTKG